MNQMMTPNVDITLVIRKSAEGRMAVSVLPKSNTLKDEAQNSIVPLTLNGTPEELDSGFMQVVARPMQKASGLISNMAQFEAQANKAASSSKGAKEAKTKESKEDREKREKYEKIRKTEFRAGNKQRRKKIFYNERYAGESGQNAARREFIRRFFHIRTAQPITGGCATAVVGASFSLCGAQYIAPESPSSGS